MGFKRQLTTVMALFGLATIFGMKNPAPKPRKNYRSGGGGSGSTKATNVSQKKADRKRKARRRMHNASRINNRANSKH